MPTIDENLHAWNTDWPGDGEQWSNVWGGSASQWYGTLLPRIRSFVPASTILEIAPGMGRWSRFLRPLAERLILVDLSPKCIEACRCRFAGEEGVECHVNDGRSLGMVPAASVDFVFSFDSLVHAEADVLQSYLAEIARTLAPEGVAFLHHSNLAELVGVENTHWRATSVSAELVRNWCTKRGLRCVSQEIVNWGKHLTDALTVVASPGSGWTRECVVLRNPDFMREARYLARLATLYDNASAATG